jgi:hypothetical protein
MLGHPALGVGDRLTTCHYEKVNCFGLGTIRLIGFDLGIGNKDY